MPPHHIQQIEGDAAVGPSSTLTPEDFVRAWEEQLSPEQRELLIPRLLKATDLGKRALAGVGVAWRPDYR